MSILKVQIDPKVEAAASLVDTKHETANPVTSHSRLQYHPGIDGLRAIAVMAVMFYHAEVPWMPGGFLGVEVFFVISGYLITSILLVEWRKNAFINLGRFWFRRARRLLPAVFLLLLVTLAFTVLFLPNEVASLRIDALAAAVYVSNWYQVFSHKSYFEAIGRPPLLRHLWSLAVEEQFYLIWPVVVAVALRWFRPRIRLLYPLLTLGLAIASIALMTALYQPDIDPSRVYYGTDTRAAGFLIGAALAMMLTFAGELKIKTRSASVWITVIGVAALVGLLACFVRLDEINPSLYPGGFTLISVMTALVILAVTSSGAQLLRAVLGSRWLVWLGLRSYSIYLWHWPIFDVTRPHLDVALDGFPLLLLRLGLTLICAELSYRFVERPIRDGAIGRLLEKLRGGSTKPVIIRSLVYALASMCVLGALLVTVVNAKPVDIPAEYAEAPIETPVVPTEQVNDASPRPVVTSEPATSLPLPTNTTALLVTPMPARNNTQYQPQWPFSLLSATTATSAPVRSTQQKDRTPVAQTATPIGTLVSALQTPTPVSTVVVTNPMPALIASVSGFTQTITDVLGADYHVVAIGDSVMLGASQALQRAFGGAEVDAIVSRQAVAAIADLQQRRDAGKLGDIVVLHIGSNGYVTQKQFDDMMQILSGVRIVAVVNVRVPRRWEGPNNTLFAEGVKKTPNAVLVDWNAASDLRPEVFVEDGVHLQPIGRILYAQTILSQVKAFNQVLNQNQGAGNSPK